MATRAAILKQVMLESDITQAELARVSGVRQPSISQFMSGTTELSDRQLDRLLGCMGFRLEVVRRPVEVEMTHAERRSWMLHRRLSRLLTPESFSQWRPVLLDNVGRLRESTRGEIHRGHIDRWSELVANARLNDMHRALVGLDRRSVEMREVSPFSGLLPDRDRREVLAELKRA